MTRYTTIDEVNAAYTSAGRASTCCCCRQRQRGKDIQIQSVQACSLSSSARLRFIEAQDLVHGKQNNLLKLNEIEKADRTRLDYLFGVIT